MVIGREEFYLTNEEADFLEEASGKGINLVWFDTMAVSIPKISYLEKIGVGEKNQELPSPTLEPTTEEQKLSRKKIDEIRSIYKDKIFKKP